jgi:hypothetical protein
MPSEKIQEWLSYWNDAGMVKVEEIRALGDVFSARKYCKCMRVGVFAEVSDLQIWRALNEMRGSK